MRSLWSSVTSSGGTRRPPATPDDKHNFLPQDTVIISDRIRHASKLGEGSFTKVFRGEYNGKPCTVKVFKEDVLMKELTPLRSEVEMLSNVQHTNIVKMYVAAPSIVMELCDELQYDFIRRFKALFAHMYSLWRQSFHWVGGWVGVVWWCVVWCACIKEWKAISGGTGAIVYVICYHQQQIYIVEIESEARQLMK